MKLKIIPGKPIILFVRIKGRKGIREYRAVLDTGSEYCVIPTQDARDLGYEAYFDPIADSGRGTTIISKTDMIELAEIELEEVSVADIVAKNVKAFAHYLPKYAGVEVTLGLSFLKNFKTSLDYANNYLTIETLKK